MSDELTMVARLAVAGGLGAAIGFEREARNQIAGLRTHALVAIGAALFTLAGAYGFTDVHKGPNVDPLRVAAQIASGIGFLGAGAIIRNGRSVRGLTTAATLWLAAAVGLACGAGLLFVATTGVAIIVAILVGFRQLEPHVAGRFGPPVHAVEVRYERGHGTLGPLIREVEGIDGELRSVTLDDGGEDVRQPGWRTATVAIATRDAPGLWAIADELRRRPEVASVRVR